MRDSRPDVGDEYLSQVAHELRGSLNAILGWAEFLRRADSGDAACVRAAETIIRHARQQSVMLTELMDIWRLSSGALKFSVSSFDVRHMVQDAVDGVQSLAQGRTVRLRVNPDAAARDLRGRGDVKRLSQALTALLLNAVHFAPEESIIDVTLSVGDDGAEIAIRDDGLAVPLSALPYVFERERPPERSTARATFRLGLTFARDVITRHGGSIEAESAGGENGLTFRIALPVTRVAHEAGPVQTAVRNNIQMEFSGPPELGGLRVLLVDDEPDAREALRGILQLHGAVVRTAGSAADAIGALQHDTYDVLLADIGMPGADGYDLIRYVRGLENGAARHMPAAAVTAFASDADRRRALDAGFQVHLSKPVDPASLVATVAVLGRPAVARTTGPA
jgi:CheY-like chemotaxis protein